MKAEFFALILLLNTESTELHTTPDYYGPQLLDQETCVDVVKGRVQELQNMQAAPKILGICVFVPSNSSEEEQQKTIKQQIQALLVNRRGGQSVPGNWKE